MNTLYVVLAEAWWAPLAHAGVELLASLLLAVGLVVLGKVYQKLGIDKSASETNLYDTQLRKAAGYAEEWAHRQVSVLGQKAPTGPEKLAVAAQRAAQLFQESGLKARSVKWVEDHLHELLGTNRHKMLRLEGRLDTVRASGEPPAA